MLHLLGVHYTDALPMKPEGADFGVTIDFERGKSDPVQVFTAMTELLRAFSNMDRLLVGAVAPRADVMSVIEDIEAASITAWVKNILRQADDEAIKSMDVKKAVGVYLVKAKYKIIEYADTYQAWADERRRDQLKADLSALAEEAGAPTLAPPQVDVRMLEGPINEVQTAKERLAQGETITLRGQGMPDMKVDTSNTERVDFEPRSAPSEPMDGGGAEMLLLIRKPDLIGRAKWDFRHGKHSISASIEALGWMTRFHRGEIAIAPGSEMRAKVRLTYQRDSSGGITGVDYAVTEVVDVIAPTHEGTARLFPDET